MLHLGYVRHEPAAVRRSSSTKQTDAEMKKKLLSAGLGLDRFALFCAAPPDIAALQEGPAASPAANVQLSLCLPRTVVAQLHVPTCGESFSGLFEETWQAYTHLGVLSWRDANRLAKWPANRFCNSSRSLTPARDRRAADPPSATSTAPPTVLCSRATLASSAQSSNSILYPFDPDRHPHQTSALPQMRL